MLHHVFCGGLLALLAVAQAGEPPLAPRERRPEGQAISRDTSHLSFTATLSPAVVTSGTRMSIVVSVTPKPGMHLYAPGSRYRAVTLTLDPDPTLQPHEPVYPPAARYLFKPLNEQVLVYSRPFELKVDITAGGTDQARAQMKTRGDVRVTGRLQYQACDDRVCYMPVSVPVKWTVRIAR